MKSRWSIFGVFVLLLFGLTGPAGARIVTPEQAERVATNWITMVIALKGDWGGAPSAQVADVREFKRGDRLLGYYCPVDPTGQIVVSLVEGLAPVKEFSETCVFNPASDEGPADALKLQMERLLTDIEASLGPLSQIRSVDLDAVLDLNHRAIWKEMDVDPAVYREQSSVLRSMDNYGQGWILLMSNWHQHDPYNRQCPPAAPGCGEANCTVGCVALAGAQIMRYWSWPPGRSWWAMPDTLDATDWAGQINTTAELCRAVGDAVGMDYCSDGCESSSYTKDMEGVYEAWAYDGDCAVAYRPDHTWVEWYNLIMDECNQNRPIHYRIEGHSIVCDGYWNLPTPLYHMNYGWADSFNDWYTIDALHQPGGGSISDEYMVLRIRPNVRTGPALIGPQPSSYHYVDQDCLGTGVILPAGSTLQFLPWVELTCASGYILVGGSPGSHSRLFTVDAGRGVRIENGTMAVYPGGSVKFGLYRRP